MKLTPQLREFILDKIKTLNEEINSLTTLRNNTKEDDMRDSLAMDIDLMDQNLKTLRVWIIKDEAEF